MSKQDESNNEYFCLQLLLDKWKLPHFRHHFISQKINVEVLKIMKLRHISDAVTCFPLGDRIRFEHELENWRESIGLPLEDIKVPNGLSTIPSKQNSSNQASQTSAPTSPIPDEEEDSIIATVVPTATVTPTVPPIIVKKHAVTSSQEAPQTGSTTSKRTLRQSNSRYNPFVAATASFSRKKRTNIEFKPPKHLIVTAPSNLDVNTIIMQSVPRGPQLVQIYEARRCFTPSERCELINLVAKYFYQNAIHLSVKLSHCLENQILKLFPGERLKDYRTDKRGRIYIRYGNIKNFRARSERAKQHHESLQQFVIQSVEENEEEMSVSQPDDELNEVPVLDESNSSDHILGHSLRTDNESYSADHFVYDVVKTEAQEENDVFQPETRLEETE